MRLIPDRLLLEGDAAKNHYNLFMKNREPSKIFNFYSFDYNPLYVTIIFTIWFLPFSFFVWYGFLLWLIFHLAISTLCYYGFYWKYYVEFYEPEQVFVFIEHSASINKFQYVIIERHDGDKVCIANKFHERNGAIFDYRYSDQYQEYLYKFPNIREKIELFCREYGIHINDVSGGIRYRPSSSKSIITSFVLFTGLLILLIVYSLYIME